MANWCSNTVVFEGKPETITAIQELFQSMKEKEEKSEEGQLPKFISKDNGAACLDGSAPGLYIYSIYLIKTKY